MTDRCEQCIDLAERTRPRCSKCVVLAAKLVDVERKLRDLDQTLSAREKEVAILEQKLAESMALARSYEDRLCSVVVTASGWRR